MKIRYKIKEETPSPVRYNIVVYENDSWYFYNEEWVPIGPFTTKWEAESELILYYTTMQQYDNW